MKKKILLIILLMFPYASYAYSDKIIPGGNTIGIEVSSPGVMVVGFYKVDGKYNRGKPELKNGDYIIKINDEDIETVNDLVKAIDKYKMDKKVNITFTRNKIEKDTVLNLVEIDGVYKTGLYVKDSITGIGTLSYIDPESKIYGALGHEIIESNSKEMVEVKTGNIFRNYITSIDRSENGSPGSKNAKFYNNTIYGDIKKNTKYGIYGLYNYKFKLNDALEIKKLSDVNLGKAYIRTVTDGEEIKDYEIEITSINKNSKLKSISFKITDEELLKKAGGIVQGMSGSPIIQDNYLIGAVTHVLVDNVTNGYGVSIITMLDEGDKLIK